MDQIWLWMFLGLLAAGICESVVPQNTKVGSIMHLETVRQCSCQEVQKCLHNVWDHFSCTYHGGGLSRSTEGKGLEFLDKCSSQKIRGYCTPNGNEFISISDFGYVENNGTSDHDVQLCFNENVIKCFKREGCDIVSHNVVLKKVYDQCSKSMAKYMIELMAKYPELVSPSQIETAKMEYSKKYNESFVSSDSYSIMFNAFTILGFVGLSLII